MPCTKTGPVSRPFGFNSVAYSSRTRPDASTRTRATSMIGSPGRGEAGRLHVDHRVHTVVPIPALAGGIPVHEQQTPRTRLRKRSSPAATSGRTRLRRRNRSWRHLYRGPLDLHAIFRRRQLGPGRPGAPPPQPPTEGQQHQQANYEFHEAPRHISTPNRRQPYASGNLPLRSETNSLDRCLASPAWVPTPVRLPVLLLMTAGIALRAVLLEAAVTTSPHTLTMGGIVELRRAGAAGGAMPVRRPGRSEWRARRRRRVRPH